jgi:hypothetical protein
MTNTLPASCPTGGGAAALCPPIDKPPDAIRPALLTAAQAAELVGIKARTLAEWVRKGLAPAPLKIGTQLKQATSRFRTADLLAWVDGGCLPVLGRAMP